MSEQKPLIKLEGDVYHVNKEKMEVVLKYLLARPFMEVGGILKGLVDFNTDGQQKGQADAGQSEPAK